MAYSNSGRDTCTNVSIIINISIIVIIITNIIIVVINIIL